MEKLQHSPLVLSLFYLLLFTLFISPVIYTMSPAFTRIGILSYLFVPGIILAVAGFYIRYKGLKELLKVNKAVEQDSIPKVLVTKGIYTYSRNPAYLGLMLIILGSLLMYPNLAMAIITLLLFVSFNSWVKEEERTLSKKFGKAYLRYKRKTHRWL